MASAATTGVPSGTQLTAYTGPMTITTPGTVIDGKIINGSLRILADNVVIKNSLIQFNGSWGVDAYGYKNTTVQDCDIVGPGYGGSSDSAIAGTGNFLRNDISKVQNAITLNNGSSVVQGNYIHDLQSAGADPHYDGIQVFGGQRDVLIADNTIIARDTSNILISDLWGAVSNVTIRNNFLGGNPSYNIYVTGDHGNGTTGVTIQGNQIARGYYGYYSIVEANPTITGNTELPRGTMPGDVGPLPDDPTPPPGGGDPTILNGTPGDDTLPSSGRSMAGSQTLRGLDGNDLLRGGAGGDSLEGGGGIDTATYAGSTAGVRVNLQTRGASDGDAAGDTFSSIENLTGSSHADRLTGNAAANVLDGSGGADRLRGLGGDDTYIVDNTGDVVDESVTGSGGVDTVRSSRSVDLSDADHFRGGIERVVLLGSGNVNATGNDLANGLTGNGGANVLAAGAGNDTLVGGAGNDNLNGGTGNDTMRGGAGNDVYVVDNASDTVDEGAAGSNGTDTVQSSVSFNLVTSARVLGTLENLTLLGSANVSGTGTAANNVITGNGGANSLSGGGGNDSLNGGSGTDTLNGGTGIDSLRGGAGSDFFVFNVPFSATNRDTIADFNPVDDTIRVENAVMTALGTATGALKSGSFHVGTAAHDADDRIIYNRSTGELVYDSNGNGAGGAVVLAKLSANLNLTSADFNVI